MSKFSLRKVNKDLRPLQEQYSDGELATLSKHGTIIDIAPGQNLMEEGTVGSEVAVILEGHAKITVNGDVIAEAGVGDVIGEKAVLLSEPRAASVCAATLLKILVLGVEAFANVLTDSDEFRRRIDTQVQSQGA